MYEDEQDYDISKAGETTFTVPLNISVYPYTEYTTRNLVITKGDSKLKQIQYLLRIMMRLYQDVLLLMITANM